MHAVSLGEVRSLLRRVALTMLFFEAVIAVILTIRFRVLYFDDAPTAAWHGVVSLRHGVQQRRVRPAKRQPGAVCRRAWLIFPICVAVFAGAISFPVMAELFNGWRKPRLWTIHTRLTVWGSIALFVLAAVAFLMAEWNNPGTLGATGRWHKVVTGVEGGIMSRSGGFNSFDYAQVRPETLGFSTIMMFIGGGSASTAGGIKVTTFLLLAYVIRAELRGDPEVLIGKRSISSATIRQALTIALLAVMLVACTTLLILAMTDFSLDQALFLRLS